MSLTTGTNSLVPFDARAAWHAVQIRTHWQKTAQGFIDTGRALLAAKAEIGHGGFGEFCETCLPFNRRTAERLMAIAEDPRLADPKLAPKLPPSWDTLYVLTRLDDESFHARIADGSINPDMRRNEVANGLTESRRQDRLGEMRELAANPMKLPAGPFAAAIADPPWENSDAPIGFSDRHYRNKYATLTPDQVAALPVAAILAKRAFMALWITSHHLALGSHLRCFEKWNLEPKTVATWDKVWPGLGNGFFRDRTEHLVIGTRGDVPAPCAAERPSSLYVEKRTAVHSAKPESWLHDMIEIWFPNMSYVELFARAPRKGWATWGNQAGGEEAA